MTGPGQALANTLAVAAITLSAAGLAGMVAEYTGHSDRLHAAIRRRVRRLRAAVQTRIRTATRDRVVDLGDWDPDISRDMDTAIANVTDPLQPFCCPAYPECIHHDRMSALFGEPDAEYAALLAADETAWRRWLDSNWRTEA